VIATTLIVITIAQTPATDCEPGACGGEAMGAAFGEAVRRVLGRDIVIRQEAAAADPADEDAEARASGNDGVVELSFSPSGDRAHLHCYLARERRWLDREIGFGERRAGLRTEIAERGRLLGFAVATMFGGSDAPDGAPTEPPPAKPAGTAPAAVTSSAARAPSSDTRATTDVERPSRSIEFAGVASTGLRGSAGSLGASAGLRLRATGPLWVRGFISGRTGNLPTAQATTRTALIGGGVSLSWSPRASAFEVGARFDAFVSYFDATHLSEDDVEPDRRSRWLPGGALVAEAAGRFTSSTAATLGLGLEGMLGKTDIYTHDLRVAVVPPLRVIAEVGFRSHF